MVGWAVSFLADPRPWTVLAVSTVVALAATRPLARRTGWPPWATAGTEPSAWWRALTATGHRGERVGNIAMFIPATCFAVLATRRPLPVTPSG